MNKKNKLSYIANRTAPKDEVVCCRICCANCPVKKLCYATLGDASEIEAKIRYDAMQKIIKRHLKKEAKPAHD